MKTDRDINFYIEKAMEKGGYSSYRKLQAALGYTGNQVVFMRKGHSLPSPEKMVELAKFAGIDPAIALMDLAMWNTQGEAQKTYAKILQKLSKTACIALASGAVMAGLGASPAIAQANEILSSEVRNNIPYGISGLFSRFRKRIKLLILNVNHLFTLKVSNISVQKYFTLYKGVSTYA